MAIPPGTAPPRGAGHGDRAPTFAGGQAGRNGTLSSTKARWRCAGFRPITTVRPYRAGISASADVGCSRLLLNLGAGRGLRLKLQHGRTLLLTDACHQDTTA